MTEHIKPGTGTVEANNLRTQKGETFNCRIPRVIRKKGQMFPLMPNWQTSATKLA